MTHKEHGQCGIAHSSFASSTASSSSSSPSLTCSMKRASEGCMPCSTARVNQWTTLSYNKYRYKHERSMPQLQHKSLGSLQGHSHGSGLRHSRCMRVIREHLSKMLASRHTLERRRLCTNFVLKHSNVESIVHGSHQQKKSRVMQPAE